jgi:hypothetical protein
MVQKFRFGVDHVETALIREEAQRVGTGAA